MTSGDQRGKLYVGRHDSIILFRIVGHGCFDLSQDMQDLAMLYIDEDCSRIEIDFQDCNYIDSTFIGAMCSMALRLKDSFDSTLQIANMNEYIRDTLDKMGLLSLFEEIQDEYRAEIPEVAPVTPQERTRLERRQHVLDAHESLVKYDERNLVKFRTVIDVLREELKQKNPN